MYVCTRSCISVYLFSGSLKPIWFFLKKKLLDNDNVVTAETKGLSYTISLLYLHKRVIKINKSPHKQTFIMHAHKNTRGCTQRANHAVSVFVFVMVELSI